MDAENSCEIHYEGTTHRDHVITVWANRRIGTDRWLLDVVIRGADGTTAQSFRTHFASNPAEALAQGLSVGHG